jgi:hypothetical protein
MLAALDTNYIIIFRNAEKDFLKYFFFTEQNLESIKIFKPNLAI